jgi:hypothetical protein
MEPVVSADPFYIRWQMIEQINADASVNRHR